MPRSGSHSAHDAHAPGELTAVEWLRSDSHGATVLSTAKLLLSAESAIKAMLPPALAHSCKVARIDRQQITVAVPSAAYAAKIRQLAPSITRALTRDGRNINEVVVKVQAGLLKNQTKTTQMKTAMPLDDAALSAFEELKEKVGPSPLADAIQQLLRHHRGR
jgi:hypothetical protein